jgi:hypothetical protein
MGLDAVIFCDCVEKKRLRIPHPYPRLLYIRSNGSLEIRSDPGKIAKHDEWMETPPCGHESMMLDGCSLGNMTLIQRVRDAIASIAQRTSLTEYPILLGKVLYSGTHTGDHLAITQVSKLILEIQQLRKRVGLNNAEISLVGRREVISILVELERLARVSRKVSKPIAF